MGNIFSTFFEIGTALALSILVFLVLPSYFLIKKLNR